LDLVGQHVGNYRLEVKLDEGAMGEVYLARHPMIGKEVAVKILRDELSRDAELVGRFFQEAKAVNEINHPNIVDIIDYGHVGDLFYFTMERLHGENLSSRLWSTGLTLDESRRVLAQCASALAACHDQGIIHRDLKPDNIFLIKRGRDPLFVKLLDFGVAKLTKPGMRVVNTQMGDIFGTPLYMSPEQAEGRSNLDARSDIYSLGVVMYELLTGVVPFDKETAPLTLLAQMSETPKRPSEINPMLPAQLEGICLRAMEKSPSARFATMHEFLRALEDPERYLAAQAPDSSPIVKAVPFRRTLSTLRVQRTPSGPVVTQKRRARFRPGPMVAALALLVALSAGVVWSLKPRAVTARADGVPQRNVVTPLVVPAPAAPHMVRLRVTADPSPSLVFRDGVSIGATPVVLEAERATPLRLEVRHPGFQNFSKTLTPQDDGELEVSLLTRAPSRKPPVEHAAKTRPAATTTPPAQSSPADDLRLVDPKWK
jgi:serine/threonine-protein kinase